MLFPIEEFMVHELKLSSGELLVYASIYYADKEGVIEEWYKECGAGGSSTVRNLVRKLEDKGLVIREEDNNGRQIYFCKRWKGLEKSSDREEKTDSVYSSSGKVNPRAILFKSQGR